MFNFKKALELKNIIKNNLSENNLIIAKDLISNYEKDFNFDVELYSIKANIFIIENKLAEALNILLQAKNKFEYNREILLNLGIVYYNLNNIRNSLINFSEVIIHTTEDDELSSIANSNIDHIMTNFASKEDLLYVSNHLNKLEISQTIFPLLKNNSSVGKFINIPTNKYRYFCGLYDNYYLQKSDFSLESLTNISSKLSLHEIITEILPSYETNFFEKTFESDVILPILSKETRIINFFINGKSQRKNLFKNTWYYFRFCKNDTLKIENKYKSFLVAKEFPIIYNSSNPKIILNIFVDGLSKSYLENYDFKKCMPNAYNFFKKGLVFDNCYVSGDWTFVSLASFFTGKYTHNHMMFNPNKYTSKLNNNVLFTKYLKEQNFLTAKIDGDWRSSPAYGYCTDIDRTVYCPSVKHMNSNEIVTEAIEHMEAFKDFNQFLWICLPDLHDVADEYEPQISMQTNQSYNLRFFDESKTTSVRKKFSPGKVARYKYSIKRLDTYLSMLFSYIENNYSDDEFIVNLVSDHGQGYLIKDDSFFLEEERTKVPLMIRGKNIPTGTCDELIQSLDLYKIICKEAGCSNVTIENDSNLPMILGGNKERDYSFAESLFPNDPYRAAIYDKTHKFFFETTEIVTSDGLLDLSDIKVKLVNKETKLDETDKFPEKANTFKENIINKIKYNMYIK